MSIIRLGWLSLPILIALSSFLGVALSAQISGMQGQFGLILTLSTALLMIGLIIQHRFRALLLMLFLFLGAALHYHHHYVDHAPAQAPSTPATLTGLVSSLSNQSGDAQSFRLTITESENPAYQYLINKNAQVRLYRTRYPVQPGDRVRITGKWQSIEADKNPYGFQYSHYLRYQHLHLKINLQDQSAIEKIAHDQCCHIDQLRRDIRDRLQRWQDQPHYGLLLGLAIGDRSAITDHQREVLQGTGTSHLLAISGLHIGLVAGFTALLLWPLVTRSTRLTSRYPAPMIIAILSIGPAGYYALLSGLNVPALRAALTLMIIAVTIWRVRHVRVSDLFAWVLTINLWISPLDILSPSFWLSYGATAIIIIYVQQSRRFNHRFNATAFRDLWWLQLGIMAGMALLSVYFFQGFSWLGPLANIIAIPWVSVMVVPPILIGMTVGNLSPLIQEICINIALYGLERLWVWIEALYNWQPFGVNGFINLPAPSTIGLLLSPLLAITIAARLQSWRWNLAALMILIIAYLPFSQITPKSDQFTLLAVGNSLISVYEPSDKHQNPIIIGAGDRPFYGEPKAQYALLPYLQARHLHPDRLILPMLHNAVSGGTRTIRQQYPDIQVRTPVADPIIESLACDQTIIDENHRMTHTLWESSDRIICLVQISLGRSPEQRNLLMLPARLLVDQPIRDWIERQADQQKLDTIILYHTKRNPLRLGTTIQSWLQRTSLDLIVSGELADDLDTDILNTHRHGAIKLTASSTTPLNPKDTDTQWQAILSAPYFP